MFADVGERKNLATSHPEKTAELHNLLKQWRAETEVRVSTQLNPKYNAK